MVYSYLSLHLPHYLHVDLSVLYLLYSQMQYCELFPRLETPISTFFIYYIMGNTIFLLTNLVADKVVF